MRRRDHRAMASRELADVLDRLAADYRGLARDIVREIVGVRDADGHRGRVHRATRALDPAVDLNRVLELDHVLAGFRLIDLTGVLDSFLDQNGDGVINLADVLERVVDLADRLGGRASLLRADGQQNTLPRRQDDGVEVRVLSLLARLLPATERLRFVAEERGNLSDCECWWQRVDRLVDLAIETPLLAWMMRREAWRSRA